MRPAAGGKGADPGVIISLGDRVRPGDYTLHSKFARAINYANTDSLLTLVTPEIGAGPANIVVRDLNGLSGGRLTVSRRELIVGGRALRIDRRRLYRSRLPLTVPAARRLAKNLDIFAAALCAGAQEHDLTFLLGPPPPPARSAFVRKFRTRFAAGVAEIFGGRLYPGLAKIRGLGFGLTPSGDDFIAGLLAALPVLEQLHRVSLARLRDRVHRAACGTNRLANSFLTLARDGCFSARFRALLLALSRGREYNIRVQTKGLLAMGETSGSDMGVGFLMTVRQGGGLCR